MFERDELAAWLRLLETPQVGRESARKLLAAFGSPEAVLGASVAARREVVGPGPAGALGVAVPGIDALVDATQAWVAADATGSRRVITLGDPLYPPALLQTADPPLLLYAQGRAELLGAPCLAIVGSRNPTAQGRDNAREFAATLSRAGLTIVSGLALGVDGAAHEGALEGPASTIAVVATGLDRVYPRRHLGLAHRIASEGLMLSEHALGTPPLQAHFPLRNRIIAGLSQGTLVVEAALQSGSLITARLAAEAGREVFAIPGSIHSPQARGCHALIKQGAKLVDAAQDILEELRLDRPAANSSASEPPAPADPLLDALGYDPVTLDALVARTGWSAEALNTRLLELELDGRVARLPGQLFQRIATG
ncbi:MAG TPA: DNA-processing protein DprA [Albitalea sp.]|uniref:DNA-processing protein DprA n=1 Tax=Piscinibacter sp. TaxID=1903157 RepID=UPI002ED52373